MIVADGDAWRKTHDAIMPHLLPPQVNGRHGPAIRSAADETLSTLATRTIGRVGAAAPMTVDVERWMRIILSRIMGAPLFGAVLTVEEAEYLEQLLDLATRVPDGPLCNAVNAAFAGAFGLLNLQERQPVVLPPPQRRALDELIRWIDGKIEASHRSDDPQTVVDSLRQRYADQSARRRKRAVAAECAMMSIAGIDTTAAALTFAVAEIARNPALRDAVVAEARLTSVGTTGQATASTQYPLIHRVILEALRRHTIVPTMLREAEADYAVAEQASMPSAPTAQIQIKRGSILRYWPVRSHMRKSVWGDPYSFDPDRFLPALNLGQKKTYHPFGMGPQSCPGQAMALTESVLILSAFFKAFNLEQAELSTEIQVRRNAVFTNRPVGVTIRISPVIDPTQAAVTIAIGAQQAPQL